MNLKTRSREEPTVNLTSLIDVVLLLLIFFMVSTSFVKDSQISIRLPEADTVPQVIETPERIEILITASGGIWVNKRELIDHRKATLLSALIDVSAGNSELPLVIAADADARHQLVVTAMEVAGELGFAEVSIATVNDSPGD